MTANQAAGFCLGMAGVAAFLLLLHYGSRLLIALTQLFGRYHD